MRVRSPLTKWREQYGLSVAELADLCNVSEAEIARIEAGKQGLIGEVQDCPTQRGENVSAPAGFGDPALQNGRPTPRSSALALSDSSPIAHGPRSFGEGGSAKGEVEGSEVEGAGMSSAASPPALAVSACPL